MAMPGMAGADLARVVCADPGVSPPRVLLLTWLRAHLVGQSFDEQPNGTVKRARS